MTRTMIFSAAIMIFCVFSVYAEESTVTGDMDLDTNSTGIVMNASLFSDSEATTSSVAVKNNSVLEGHVTSRTYGSVAVMNATVGASATATLTSVKISGNSLMTGNVSATTSGAAVINLAAGMNASASMGSVIIE